MPSLTVGHNDSPFYRIMAIINQTVEQMLPSMLPAWSNKFNFGFITYDANDVICTTLFIRCSSFYNFFQFVALGKQNGKMHAQRVTTNRALTSLHRRDYNNPNSVNLILLRKIGKSSAVRREIVCACSILHTPQILVPKWLHNLPPLEKLALRSFPALKKPSWWNR